MKKICFALILAFLALASCSRRAPDYFRSLDRAIELQSFYDDKITHVQDSLWMLCLGAPTDSAAWDAAYALEKILFYRDIDSCYLCVKDMLRLSGADRSRRLLSECCYSNILYKMDSLQAARRVFEQIDTAGIGTEALGIYCFAGYHIYGALRHESEEYSSYMRDLIEQWWQRDSTKIECASYRNAVLGNGGIAEGSVRRLTSCVLTSPNDTAKAYYFLAREYLNQGDNANAIKYFATSAECDMRLGARAYNALYELARILFRTGDIERADRYMRITLKDAYSSHYETRYDDVIRSELEVLNVLLDQQQKKRRAYFTTIIAIAMLLIVAIISILLLSRYSTRLSVSRRKLSEVSKIKDSFLANYMEKCVDYLNKVDEYRSSLRQTIKHDGPDAVAAMLRRPSFADGEFDGLLEHFDSAFLSIFPDFVDKVNQHMQEEYRLAMPSEGVLSTELRILALIRMGISKRKRIAKVLNMSVTTVYSYHCNLQKHSLHPDGGFDRVIANL